MKKKILITGKNSYIGTSFEKYIHSEFSDNYIIESVDMTDPCWREKSFSGYDTVFHVSGIAHRRETKENAHLYYEVNRDLTVETAEKAKADGVKQFVFLSSMSVYGKDAGIITKETKAEPKSHYGRSKYEAEQLLTQLADENFKVCILRPPMVYGKDCKGNFNSVLALVNKSPIFPKIKNQRSMIYIDNLSSFVKMCADRELMGIYFPQNREYVSTSDMAQVIASAMNKRVLSEPLSGICVAAMRLFVPKVKKAFGSLIYRDTEEFDYSYVTTENKESFIKSV